MDVKVLNRGICSYKMVEVPRDAYAVTEEEQEIYPYRSSRGRCSWNIASGPPTSLLLVEGDLKEIPLYRSSNIGIDGRVGAGSENRHLCRVNVGDNIQPPNIHDGFQARRRKHREVLARG